MFNNIFVNYIKRYIEEKVINYERVFDDNLKNYSLKLPDDLNDYKDEIYNFIDVFLRHFSVVDQKNMIDSLKMLKIKNVYDPWVGGGYDCRSKKLILNGTLKNNNIIYHELFHMASSYNDRGVYYSGLSRLSKLINLGNGINEGYTELITKRYFDIYDIDNTYYYLAIVMEILEKIIGRDKMEHYYLQGSLGNLIKEMMKYSSLDKVTRFILNCDYLLKHMLDSNLDVVVQENFENSIREIVNYLVNTYYNKLKIDMDNNILSIEVAKDNMNDVVNILFDECMIGEHKFDVSGFTYDKKDLVNQVFKSKDITIFVTYLYNDYRR